MTRFHWNSTNLKPSFSSCGFYVTSKHLRCSQQNLFCLNFCGQFSLCESLIKGRILMYRAHEFFSLKKIFHRTFCWHEIDSKLVFAFDNAFPLHNFIVFGFDYSFIILCKKWFAASLIGMMHQAISWNIVLAHVRYQPYIFLF